MTTTLPTCMVALWSPKGNLSCEEVVLGPRTATFQTNLLVEAGSLLATARGERILSFRVVSVSHSEGSTLAQQLIAELQPLSEHEFSKLKAESQVTSAPSVYINNASFDAQGHGATTGFNFSADIDMSQQTTSFSSVGLIRAIDASELSEADKSELKGLTEEFSRQQGTSGALTAYLALVGALADHIGVLGPALPWLPPVIDSLQQMSIGFFS